MSQVDAILIAGPTASGKSGFALDIAQRVGGEIINTDSMQVYPVLNVLTARPPEQDLAKISHHLYGHVAPETSYSVAQWVEQAEAVFEAVRGRGAVPIFVGGTGLYFMALEQGLSSVPPIPEEIRVAVRQDLIDQGSSALHVRLQDVDPQAAEALKQGDGHRIARALEVFLAHGQTLASFHGKTESSGFLHGKNLQKHLLMPERSLLHERINQRGDVMMEEGAVAEVEALLALELPRDATIRRAIGVAPISSYLRGEQNLIDTKNRLKTITRQYAKRQMTWFRNRLGEEWTRHSVV